METQVRSHAKINLGLYLGAPRPDGFHSLVTVYQTLAMYDVVTVSARTAPATAIRLTSNGERVPVDARNTAWKMVELALESLRVSAEVDIHIDKRLPVQGGLGAGSGNAVAALVGLEAELGLAGLRVGESAGRRVGEAAGWGGSAFPPFEQNALEARSVVGNPAAGNAGPSTPSAAADFAQDDRSVVQ